MLKWIKQFRRRRFDLTILPESWVQVLTRNAPFRNRLDPLSRQKLDHAISIFVAEKNWEGCGGFVLDDEHRVTIAAHAMRLTQGFEEDYFDEVLSILVYPSAYEAKSHERIGNGVVIEGKSARLGEAWYRGPVILTWADIEQTIEHRRSGHNVIVHEFAHQLDMRNGREADGVPVIESNEQADQWLAVTDEAFQRLRHQCHRNQHSVLDCYGTTNMAEFFAVSSEAFFQTPRRLKREYRDLYDLLARYYCQNPIEIDS